MNALSLVDTHVHLWNPAELRYPWLLGLPQLNRSFLPTDFTAATSTVDVQKWIFVEAGCDPAQSLAEVDWILRLAETDPRLKGIIAHAPLESGDAAREHLKSIAARPRVKGVRRSLQGETEDYCLQPEFITGVRLLAEFGFTFDLCIRHEQLPAATELIRRVPQVQFILDHFGKPDVRGGRIEPWSAHLRSLAALPNVVCKISGLTTEADWAHWKSADLEQYFKTALECFGFDRVLFGSDWPVATLATPYERWVETVKRLMPSATPSDWIKLFQTNAERIYRV